jgi:hypothetical protein
MALGDAAAGAIPYGGLPQCGRSAEQLLELVVLSAPVLGFPAAIDAIGAVRALRAERYHRSRRPHSGETLGARRRTANALQMELASYPIWPLAARVSVRRGDGEQGLPPRCRARPVPCSQ